MGNINVLDFHVANLIAAGEVVDRPASVVKELLENAIDAGGRSITVEIKRGGVSFIRVSDNGCGMAREDAPISLKRHATSKIREAEDLDSIATLGFRGEALAAISAVSQMRIMTKRREDAAGTLLEAQGGRVSAVSDAGCPDGTTVIVENLFYNTPARLKFLKKDGTEAANVAAYVEKIALSHPEIALRFISDGELKYSTSGDGNRRSVVYAVLGRDFSKKMTEVRGGFDGVTVSGFIGTPENIRGNRNLQIFFINNRFIRSKTASAALEQAYTTYIPSDKFPCAILYLDMNPAMVDVNVHPAKLEVKFSNERLVFESIYYTVRGALEQHLARPEMKLTAPDAEKRAAQREAVLAFTAGKEGRGGDRAPALETKNRTVWEGIEAAAGLRSKQTAEAELRAQEKELLADAAAARKPYRESETPTVEDRPLLADLPPVPSSNDDLPMTVPGHIKQEFARTPEKTSTDIAAREPTDTAVTSPAVQKPMAWKEEPQAVGTMAAAAPRSSEAELRSVPVYRMVGEIFQCYVILECGDTMYLVDKHAAHERILFETFKETARAQSDAATQLLLIPLTLAFSQEELETVRDFARELAEIGYAFTVSDRAVSVTAVPSFLGAQAAADAFTEAVIRLHEHSGTAALTRDQCYEKALFQASCKAAIKAGREYDTDHLRWICDRVMADPEIRYCPHGRPVCFEMTKSAVESRFGRT